MKKAIETMHATYIGYHGYCEEWLADNPDLTNELANRCGYWYFPVSAKLSTILNFGQNLIVIEWLNKGIAPAYNNFDLIFRFESKDLANSFEMKPVDSGNKNWLPGINKTEVYQIEIPSSTKKGDYTLKFKLVDQSQENLLIQIGIKTTQIDASGFVDLGPVNIK
jgi:hypothetical protein